MLVLILLSALPALGTEDAHLYNSTLQSYLSSFGYLPKQDPSSPNQVDSRDVKRALQDLQDFAGLPPSGQLDTSTRELLATKRCGMPDRRRNASRVKRHAPILWHKNKLTYGIQNRARTMGMNGVRRALYDAAKMWSSVSALDIQEVSNHQGADIRVSFQNGDHGDGYAFDGEGVVLAHAFYPGSDLGGDIHFDIAEPWSDQSNDWRKVQLVATAAHEMGHSLGIDHVKDKRSIMYPYYMRGSRSDSSPKLPYVDALTVQHFYGTGGNPIPTTPVPTTTSTTTTTTTTTAYHPRNTRPPRVDLDAPDVNICDEYPDAITFLRRELLVFHKTSLFRLDGEGFSADRIGRHATQLFSGLPRTLTKVDAAYKPPGEDRVLIFSGKKYWKFRHDQNRARLVVDRGYPKALTHMGLPSSLQHIDAIFKWGYNHRSYIFAGNKYWKLKRGQEEVEPDYPKDTSIWEGVPTPVDTAYTDYDDNTYFVKNAKFYKFDGRKMKVQTGWPKTIADMWAKCRNH